MKPLPTPDVPGNSEPERVDNALRTIFRVPKQAGIEERGQAEESASAKETPCKRSQLKRM